jgi:hypothetical protein
MRNGRLDYAIQIAAYELFIRPRLALGIVPK